MKQGKVHVQAGKPLEFLEGPTANLLPRAGQEALIAIGDALKEYHKAARNLTRR
jgi:hypothetical protein